MRVLDPFDKKLLRLLQQNNRLTADELSAAVNLSPSAVQRRLKKLREEKIIEADVSVVSPEALGMDITCIVDIVLQDEHSRALEKFKASMRKCPEVMQCYYVTGSYDFVIIVYARDMRQYEEFSRKWLIDNPNVRHFHTQVVMDKVKTGFGLILK
jgi:Lrp/AsnC family leucine-responsive transcriptional regulator